jgi:hypothetical protein
MTAPHSKRVPSASRASAKRNGGGVPSRRSEEDAVKDEEKLTADFDVVFSPEELARIDALIPEYSAPGAPATRSAVVYALVCMGLDGVEQERAAR